MTEAETLALRARRYGDAIRGRMEVEGFGSDPARWSDADIDTGLGECVGTGWLERTARHMREAEAEEVTT